MQSNSSHMQPQSNVYMWATWILLIIAIILGVMLWNKSDETVTDTFGDINQDLSDCRMRLIAWDEQYPATATRTAEADAELQAIIDDCEEIVVEAQGEL